MTVILYAHQTPGMVDIAQVEHKLAAFSPCCSEQLYKATVSTWWCGGSTCLRGYQPVHVVHTSAVYLPLSSAWTYEALETLELFVHRWTGLGMKTFKLEVG